ncbi:hypothetical protein [Streptomyces sp. ISL-94]|uniref:hypothetical protein n=1 Tax=Streptomyces sp. ISL-94 TaxID=2819190 RepID=UPI001BEA33C7|nr:hypothetical protein [Streptomyces sp. ISL-94]MBT2478250.1 hypothetical protein [Streptomyces sp. ISL-94]
MLTTIWSLRCSVTLAEAVRIRGARRGRAGPVRRLSEGDQATLRGLLARIDAHADDFDCQE